ncbi:hypothetical protein a10_09312 [Streptomyces acidiscabies]|nr:hypothetical protein a10_09312 [Streptomyces acidiscabies]
MTTVRDTRDAEVTGLPDVRNPARDNAESAFRPNPSVPDPFSTCTWMREGDTSTTGTAAALGRAPASGLSSRRAWKTRAERTGSHFNVDPIPFTAYPISPMGTVMNSEDDGEKFRMARPRSISSSVPNPRSARTDPSTARVTSRNRSGLKRIPEDVVRSTRAARNRCCRFIRPRSEDASACRDRTY